MRSYCKRVVETVPPLTERQKPGLSATLTGIQHPLCCQSCGTFSTSKSVNGLTRWVECDEFDKPTTTIVVLCEKCEKRLIKAHPRLYRSLWPNDPYPGTHTLCVDCVHRDGTRCPLTKANGGPGIELTTPKPTHAHLNYGGGRGEFRKMFRWPPTACSGKGVAHA